ncbi:MAG: hypothetical protein H5T74_02100 [Actinobacteria bacterium]|nr:hypothetical protein [Actinomycetota bacterium]MDI6831280.1 hypothetical protein [Actinomycetota bacterium]
MKPCPWCGRNNLDSDEYCFNCERDLDAVPDDTEAFELEEQIRRVRVQRPPSFLRLTLMSLLHKVIYGILALGLFFIFVMVAIWVSYDNTAVALAALAVLGLSLLAALYYPDVKIARRAGVRGVLVSLVTNALALGTTLPPALWYLSRRGYISGGWGVMARTWWAVPALLFLGCLFSWLAGRRATETASP